MSFPRESRTQDQQDAFAVAAWLQQADRDGKLETFLNPFLPDNERRIAQFEGWILGVV